MKSYAVIHKNNAVRIASRSGGIFTALSDYVLDQSGVVYGATFDEKYHVIHIRATDKITRDSMRGSKYVQSQLGKVFCDILNDLKNGRYVLFSGTPCQVAGLRCFLNKQYEKLLCVDIVCHGVPSPKVWDDYLNWVSKGETIKAVDFRDKIDFGWRSHVEKITTSKRCITSETFKNLFYNHYILRPSCYKCKFKNLNRAGDITIADFWGIEKVVPELDDDKGVSLVLVNNANGSKIFKLIFDSIIFREVGIEDAMQPPLLGPFSAPVTRQEFWNDYNFKNFSYIVNKYGKSKRTIFNRLFFAIEKKYKNYFVR